MPFVRRKRNQVLVVHSVRNGAAVRQAVLHTFSVVAELLEVLDGGWDAWCRMMGWRHPEIRWDFPALQVQLRTALAAWQREHGDAPQRGPDRVGEAAADLTRALTGLTSTSGSKVPEAVRPALRALQQRLCKLLDDQHTPEKPMDTAQDRTEIEDLFDDGMEHWWAGDRRRACTVYRRVLKLDPLHADAHNHLGITQLEAGKLKEAEKHFNQGIEGGARMLLREHGLVEWGYIENRPYLRCLANLGRLYNHQGRHDEAARVYEQILTLNPNDNQGVRFLLGSAYHRQGRLDDAIAAYRHAPGDPGVSFSLALAQFEAGQEHDAVIPLLRGMAENRYIAPLLLGERWSQLKGYHCTNLELPETAVDYVRDEANLWHKVPGSSEFLRRWWQAAPVREWRASLDDIMRKLDSEPIGDERSRLVYEQSSLREDHTLRRVARQVDPSRRAGMKKRRVASPDEVRVTREGDTAVVSYADPEIGATHIKYGPQLEHMTDEDILEAHNESILAMEEYAAEHEYVAVEVPLGRPRIEYSPQCRQWVPRGGVVRCVVDDPDEQPTIRIDDEELSWEEFGKLVKTWSGWGMRVVAVPEDELAEEPAIEVREPEGETPL